MMKISRSCLFAGAERILLTVWVGALITGGFVVAPVLFSTLDDRQLAGQLAGQVFRMVAYIGLVAGSLLLVSALIRTGREWSRNWRVWVLFSMLLIVAIGAFVLQPMMQELKAVGLVDGSEQAAQFSRLHGVSSLIFTVNSLLGLFLVATGLRARD